MSMIRYLAIIVSEETKDIVSRVSTSYNVGNIPVKFIYADHPKVLKTFKKTNLIASVPALIISYLDSSEKSIYYDVKIFQVLSEITSRNIGVMDDPNINIQPIEYEPQALNEVNAGKITGLGVGPSDPGIVIPQEAPFQSEESPPPEEASREGKRKKYRKHTETNEVLSKEVEISPIEGKSHAEIMKEMEKARADMDKKLYNKDV